MKSLKTIIYVASMLILGVTFTFAEAAPGKTITPLLHPGNQVQPVSKLGIGIDALTGYGISVRGSGLSQFPKPGSSFVILNNLLVLGNTWIGDKINGFKVSNGLGETSLLPLSQRLNVDGSIMATSLQNTNTNKNLCSYQHKLVPCES